MADTYSNFKQLAHGEREGHDFSVSWRHSPSGAAIVAPHGGNIEPGTTEIARAIAAGDLSYYVFEGLKYYGNRALHITSANFDEPRCLTVIGASNIVLTIHGESSDSDAVFIGGLDETLGAEVTRSLKALKFRVARHDNPKMQGHHPRNICNLGITGTGVQIEIARGLRETFFQSMCIHGRSHPKPRLAEFVSAIRNALGHDVPGKGLYDIG